jgi:transcriptional regulator with XRE-family HTH domain
VDEIQMNERRHQPVFPGFREMSERRRALSDELVERRRALGLSQTQVAARMGTSQSAVARIETGASDVLMSTVDRYASALGWRLEWSLEPEQPSHSLEPGRTGELQPGQSGDLP